VFVSSGCELPYGQSVKVGEAYSNPRMCTAAPLIIDMIQMINVGIIQLFTFAQFIFDVGLESQAPTIIMPKTSAAVPKTA
jgi:hypothetical protein